MPSQILVKYISDTSIPADKRRNVANMINEGTMSEAAAVKGITSKYGEKYGKPEDTSAGGKAADLVKGVVNNANPMKAVEGAVGMLGKAAPTIGKGLAEVGKNTTPESIATAKASFAQDHVLDDELNKLNQQMNKIGATPQGDETKDNGQGVLVPLTTQEKIEKRKQFLQEAEKRVSGINLSANIGDEVVKGVTAGADKIYKAGTDLGYAATGVGEHGEELSPEDRVLKAGQAVADVGTGGMEMVFAPAGAVANQIPVLREGVKFTMDKVNEGSKFASDQFKKQMGIDPESEQGKTIDQLFQNLGKGVFLKVTQDTTKEIGRQKGMTNAQKVGDIATYEKLAGQKPTATGAFGSDVVKGVGDVVTPVVQGAVDVAKPVVQGAATVARGTIKAAEKGVKDLTKSGLSSASGINPANIDTIIHNPKEFSNVQKIGIDASRENTLNMIKNPIDTKINDLNSSVSSNKSNIFKQAKGSLDAKLSELSDTGSLYDPIAKAKTTISLADKNGNSFFENYVKSKGLKISKGEIIADKGSAIRSAGEIARLNNLYKTYGKYTEFTPKEFLNFRRDIGELGKYGEGITSDMTSFSRGFYEKLNEKGRPQIKGLQELDTKFSPLKQGLKDAKKLIYDKEGNLRPDAFEKINSELAKGKSNTIAALKKVVPDFDALMLQVERNNAVITELQNLKSTIYKADGTLKDNAVSLANNLLNKGQEGKLARIQELLPDFDAKKFVTQVKVTKALEDIEVAKGIKVGTYARDMLRGGSVATGNVPLIVGAVLTHPTVLIPILKAYGKIANKASPYVSSVTSKIFNGIKPLEGEAAFVSGALKNIDPSMVQKLVVPQIKSETKV